MRPALADLLSDPDVTFLFGSWTAVIRVVFMSVAGYVTLLLLLRVSGQRTLSQLTAFDMVITVTVGSAFGRVITARDVALVEVIAAFGSLVLLQWIVANLWGRLPSIRSRLSPTPALLYYDGEIVWSQMRRTHLREDDLLWAARQEGLGTLDDVQAILLEGNGGMSVLTAASFGDGRVLQELPDDPRS